MEDVIAELEEQLKYAEYENEDYAEQLRKAIKVLKEHSGEETE
jgi:hypothetical protein